ncbi:hypothetical protein ACFOSC_26100 [Streptantibioticus rubrisoli]|uniref:Small EDRK-rich factor-like N-terminal domain-containing protein n=1 Tax=Streptantibioticus rubrisoli TaxID=1387313 RepID=A0ABT1PKP1_9ACTN|nr:hypothetical protein [Streptantibioticus rubrisoli]MCQ4045934.1 hypothetical protein [Streptantibioticus rubrisoli]
MARNVKSRDNKKQARHQPGNAAEQGAQRAKEASMAAHQEPLANVTEHKGRQKRFGHN